MDRYKENALKNYNIWLEKADDVTKKELLSIKDNEKEIIERFYKDLEFGTGGMRGIIGLGTNRINILCIDKLTQAFSNFLKQNKDFPSVVIAYDNRRFSKEFSESAARVFAANNIQVYLFEEITATPILSFAVRKLKADGGIVITASHNPPEYNGYKVYNSAGIQLLPNESNAVTEEFEKLDYFESVKKIDFEEGLNREKISIINHNVFDDYIDDIEAYLRSLQPNFNSNVKVVYTPLHGTGFKPINELLNKLGAKLILVKEQTVFDPNFSTVKYPNPEEKEAYNLAINLAKIHNAEIILATDPDCDRIGVFEKDKDEYIGFNGNEIGVMLSHYILTKLKEHNVLSNKGIILKTIVSTDMIFEIAKDFGVEVKQTLTGFKYIGDIIEKYSKTKEKDYIFGFEESYGYLAGTHARDKDAVITAGLITLLANELKEKNKSIKTYLDELNEKYGYFKEKLLSYQFEGLEGARKILNIMNHLRKEPPIKIDKNVLIETIDYNKGHNNLPKSNVVELNYNNIRIIARGSGTEPKIKFYILVKSDTLENSKKLLLDAEQTVSQLIQAI